MKNPRAKASLRAGYRRILWPTDFSPLAKAALPHALRLAEDRGAGLVILHVVPSAMFYTVPEISGAVWDRLARENRAAGQAELRRVTEHVRGRAWKVRIQSFLAEGIPADQIVRAARRLKCDLIVLATHGRTGLTRVVLGSVAENVVRRAPCPVLIVRPPGLARRRSR